MDKIEFGNLKWYSRQKFLTTNRFNSVKKEATLRDNSKLEVFRGRKEKKQLQVQDFVGEI